MLESGERVDGRFEVEARVGAGGMAEVYRVRHLSLGSVYALKVLSLPHPGLRERFLREGRIQAQIRHPNVVAVTDVLEHRGRLGLLMEYVDHVSLQELIERQGALSLEESLQLFARILSGVEAAHASGVLHRDLKPANILLARSAQGLVPKITDFGIAKVVLEGMPAGATRDGSMMGTPGYMAPEQARNAKDVDRRADVFALGAILYTMLAGRPPFDLHGEDLFEDVLAGRYAPLDGVVAGLPPAVVGAVHAALAPEPADRLPTARAFAEALYAERPELLALVVGSAEDSTPVSVGGALLEPRTTLATPTYAGELTPTGTLAPPVGETVLRDGGARRSGLVVIAAGALAVLLGVAALAVLLRPGPPELPEPASGPPAPTTVPATATTEATPAPASSSPPAPEAAPPTGATVEAPRARSVAITSGPAPTAPEASAPEATVAPAESPVAAAPASPASVEASAPAPEATAAAPAPEAGPPSVKGTWSGTANGRPATLAITSQSGGALKGELRLTQGPSQRVVALSGRIDASGVLRLEESGGDELVLSGALSGDTLSGTYMRAGQGKALAWELRR